jgi:hypothetical protein
MGQLELSLTAKELDRPSICGKARMSAQWHLHCLVHNMEIWQTTAGGRCAKSTFGITCFHSCTSARGGVPATGPLGSNQPHQNVARSRDVNQRDDHRQAV